MCNPLIPIALGVASAASTYAGQKKTADAQEKAQRQASQAERKRYLQELSSMRARQAQEAVARAQKKDAVDREAMKKESTQRLIAVSEAGVAGQSLNTLLHNLSVNKSRFLMSLEQQQQFNEQEVDLRMSDAGMRSYSNQLRINQPIKQASLLEAGIEGVKTGMTMYQALPSPAPKPPSPTT